MLERHATVNEIPAIDYTYKKLLEYDLDISAADKLIKDNELAVVLAEMKRMQHFKNVGSYLDIGFCTGRYPFTIQQYLSRGSYIAGVDAGYNCYEYALIQNTKRKADIHFFCSDFTTDYTHAVYYRSYELVTCMLGTISHFGERKNQLSDTLQKMANLLADNGVLIISNWTQKGIATGLLSIYNNAERKLLQRTTPNTSAIIHMLQTMHLHYNTITTNDGMLDIIFCRKR